ncbi:MAG: hypothetical protein H6812_00255 [Phycisphaeraceae bacterium]|nr:hypothetical protein [Phycisphaeraceae bacterium]
MGTPLTLEQQASLVTRWDKKIKPWYRVIDGRRWLCFDCFLQPTPSSDTYEVRVRYTFGVRPYVFVVSPQPVKEAHSQPTPHLNADGTLCLYDPAKEQWTAADPLIYTTVQWTSRWLFHYEHWLTFGEWRGDHDPVLSPKSADDPTAPALEAP